MTIEPASNVNNKRYSLGRTIGNSVLLGAIATEVHRLTLPKEVAAAIKNTRFGEDAFVKKSVKAAQKTMKNIAKGRKDNVKQIFKTPAIDLNKIAENAKNVFPGMLETAQNASKNLGKTFINVTASILAVSLLAASIKGIVDNKRAHK